MEVKMTHQERVDLFIRIIQTKLTQGLSDFSVAYLRNVAPNQPALDALNDALIQLGWKR